MQHNAYLQSDNIYPMSPVVLCCDDNNPPHHLSSPPPGPIMCGKCGVIVTPPPSRQMDLLDSPSAGKQNIYQQTYFCTFNTKLLTDWFTDLLDKG